MYELVRLTDKCYYIESPAKIGLIKTGENEVCLIDSGNDKDAGRKVRQLLDANGWMLKAIYNTHSNADHIGGNKYLQSQTGCKIYAPGIEYDFACHPILEPSFLYGGYPSRDLRHKFLMAQESDCLPLTVDSLPEGMEIIPLPGHFFDMVGFKYDGVAYIADCLSSNITLDKYGIGFVYDIESYLSTLETVKAMDSTFFVPSHAEVCEDIGELAQHNIDKVNEICKKIVDICSAPMIFEDILKRLFDEYALKMTFEQYCLVGSSVRSYLSYLKDKGALNVIFEDNYLKWHKI
ncbi:MAG: MBL fold metallo-hydrolase [Ruminococcaceae bacterium]|nr:MBL fold metallo-hydrolase [Oscillospiraceae bacterium]